MRSVGWCLAIWLAIGLSSASAIDKGRRPLTRPAGPVCPMPIPCDPTAPTPPLAPSTPTTSPPVADAPSVSSFQEALASAGEAGSQPSSSYHPGFFGDLIGGITVQSIGFIDSPIVYTDDGYVVNVAQASAIKVAESDSPRPIDRVYYLYNFYGNIDPTIDPQSAVLSLMHLHRHVIGFEKTLWKGRASVGMRIPFLGFAGDPVYQTRFVGDLTVLTKVMLVENPETRSLFSIGFVISAPTGSTPAFLQSGYIPPAIRQRARRNYPTYLQPWAGYIYNFSPRLFLHGIHAAVISSLRQEPSFITNDVGVGWWVYKNSSSDLIQGIIPTVEIHINTPVSQRGMPTQIGEVRMRDSVNLTSGCYVRTPRSLFGGAVSVPLAFGPHTIEAVASYTLRF